VGADILSRLIWAAGVFNKPSARFRACSQKRSQSRALGSFGSDFRDWLAGVPFAGGLIDTLADGAGIDNGRGFPYFAYPFCCAGVGPLTSRGRSGGGASERHDRRSPSFKCPFRRRGGVRGGGGRYLGSCRNRNFMARASLFGCLRGTTRNVFFRIDCAQWAAGHRHPAHVGQKRFRAGDIPEQPTGAELPLPCPSAARGPPQGRSSAAACWGEGRQTFLANTSRSLTSPTFPASFPPSFGWLAIRINLIRAMGMSELVLDPKLKIGWAVRCNPTGPAPKAACLKSGTQATIPAAGLAWPRPRPLAHSRALAHHHYCTGRSALFTPLSTGAEDVRLFADRPMGRIGMCVCVRLDFVLLDCVGRFSSIRPGKDGHPRFRGLGLSRRTPGLACSAGDILHHRRE